MPVATAPAFPNILPAAGVLHAATRVRPPPAAGYAIVEEVSRPSSCPGDAVGGEERAGAEHEHACARRAALTAGGLSRSDSS
ncbi:unnamed protein product [Rangifer tarandus platyrhynchus]|uniref:Uncharacterized protein n=1 Tax=Rangifer tarandus platyrhynchus TaxID=3082113 RepID=A0ABN8XPQ1_RANTA|nr:unnamed protein product [Rangifer tarandus platyrhynchus]